MKIGLTFAHLRDDIITEIVFSDEGIKPSMIIRISDVTDISTVGNLSVGILQKAKQSDRSTLIEIKVAPGTMSGGYGSWWHVPVAAVSTSKRVRESHEKMKNNIKQARQY